MIFWEGRELERKVEELSKNYEKLAAMYGYKTGRASLRRTTSYSSLNDAELTGNAVLLRQLLSVLA
jgi:hypothetical protein